MKAVISSVEQHSDSRQFSERAGRLMRMLRESMRRQTGYAGGTTVREDAVAVRRFLRQDVSLLDGPQIGEYEIKLSQMLGGGMVTTYGAARMALYVLLQAMGFREGDEIILPGYTCIVIPNAIRFAGLVPVYADIRESDLNINPDLVERAITARTRAIIVQHSFGVPGDMEALCDICSRRGLPLIEDCAHALGAELDGTKLGRIGIAGFYSTEATKMFSTEKGGLVVANETSLGERIREIQLRLPFRAESYERMMARRFLLRRWSERPMMRFPMMICRILDSKSGLRRLSQIERYDADDYAAELAGRRAEPYPCRLSNVMAAAGLGQLGRLEYDLERRRGLAREFERILTSHGARVLQYDPVRAKPSWVRFPFIVDAPDAWRERISAAGLEPGSWLNDPCHPRGSNHEFAMYRRGSCPVAERVSSRILNLPIHPRVSPAHVRRLERVLAA